MSQYRIEIADDEGRVVLSGHYGAVAAAVALQGVIATLRRPRVPQFDASYGEQPLPILAPSQEELQDFIHRSRAA